MDRIPEQYGIRYLVWEAGLALVAISPSTEPPIETLLLTEIRSVTKEWGCMWMRRSLQLPENDTWLNNVIERHTLVTVTDIFYIREMHPNIYLSVFVLECSEGSGRIVGNVDEASTHINA